MIRNNYKLQEGLDSVNRIKLLMGYDMSKTLTENKENVLIEQSVTQLSQDITKKLINSLSQINDDEEEAFNQIKRINTLEILKNVDNLVKKRTGMSLKNYIDDEMSNTFDPEYRKIMDHIDTLDDKPKYKRQGFDQPKVPIPLGIGADMIKDETGTIPYSRMRTRLTPEYKKSFQAAHPQYVWDPNYVSTRTWISDSGQQHEEKIKTGGFVLLTPENVGLRGVPFGFSPVDYPEYLKKVKEIYKKYPKSKTSIINPTTWFDSDVDDKREKLLADLKKEYYHPDFWEGISKEGYKEFIKSKQTADKEKNRQLKDLNVDLSKKRKDILKSLKTQEDMPRSDRMLDFHNNTIRRIAQSTNSSKTNPNEILSNFEMVDNYINILFGYDPGVFKEMNKSALEKLWEKYAIVGEAVFWLAIDFLTESLAVYITAPRQAIIFGKLISMMGGAEKVAAAVRFAGLSGIPISLAVSDIIKNKKVTEESIVYFIFAVLPYAHNFFSVAKPTKEVCENIIQTMSRFNLKTTEGLSGFVRLLNEEEKTLVRKILTMDKKSIETGIKQTMEGLTRMANKEIVAVGKAAGKEALSRDTFKWLSKFAGRILVDVTAIEIVKKITLSLGITLDDVKEKELIAVLDKFKENPEYRSILMMNAYFLIQQNPNWTVNDIIKQSDKDLKTTDVKEIKEINGKVVKVAKKLGFDVESTWEY
jgi:hypothetical protein